MQSGGDFQAGLKGAASGAVFGAVDGYYGDQGGYYGSKAPWSYERLAANAVAGGISSKIYGGDFASGFGSSLFTGAAKWAYSSQVGYGTNPLPGENRPGQTTYEFDENGRQYPDSIRINVVGNNNLVDSCRQGSTCSKFLNLAPGINATAGLHDYWFNAKYLEQTTLANWGTMLPAAAMTYSGLVNGPLAVQLSEKRR